MTPSLKIVLLHIMTMPWIFLILYVLRPGGPEKSFELNAKYAGSFLPGKWKDKDFFVLWTRRLGRIWLSFFLVLYGAGWFLILTSK